MAGVFAGTLLPVLSIVLLGAWLSRRLGIDAGGTSRLTLYVLSPALIFSSLSTSRVAPAESARLALAAVTLAALLYALGVLVGRLGRVPDETRSGYLLSTVFFNTGNYGLPVVLFAFGPEALPMAVVYFVTQSFLVNTLGAYVASRGRAEVREALRNATRVPALYAALLALPFALLQVTPPEPLIRPVQVVGQAAIPLLLLTLGARLSPQLDLLRDRLGLAAIGTRLVLSPMLALGLAWLFGLRGASAAVFVVQSAMPTAVFTVLLSVEFEADTRFLAGVITYSTLLSVVTLSVLIPLARSL